MSSKHFFISGLFRDNVCPILPGFDHFRDQLHGRHVVYGQETDLRGRWRPQVLWPLSGRGLLHRPSRPGQRDGPADRVSTGLAEFGRRRGDPIPKQTHKVIFHLCKTKQALFLCTFGFQASLAS